MAIISKMKNWVRLFVTELPKIVGAKNNKKATAAPMPNATRDPRDPRVTMADFETFTRLVIYWPDFEKQ